MKVNAKELLTKPRIIIVFGVLALLGWVWFLVSGAMGVDEEMARFSSDVLLALTILSALAAVWSRVRPLAITAVVAAVAYVADWYVLGRLTWSIADGIYYPMVAVFYLAVPVVGVCTILAGRKLARRAA